MLEEQPVVPNGLPLSRVHHAAFDAYLIGIDLDNRRLLLELTSTGFPSQAGSTADMGFRGDGNGLSWRQSGLTELSLATGFWTL